MFAIFFLLSFFTVINESALTANETADVIFFDGEILTMNEKQPTVEAVAIKGNKILFAGSKDSAFALKTDRTLLEDLKGKTLLPGFIDPHTHIMFEAVANGSLNLDPTQYPTFNQVLKAIKEEAKKGYVFGTNYDPSLMTEQGDLGVASLDVISTTVPILIINKSSHIGYANSVVLKNAGITDSTPQPPGGSFLKDKNGKLTGVANELPAVSMLISGLPAIKNFDYSELAKNVTKEYADAGYTTVTDAGLGIPIPTPLEGIEILKKTANAADAKIRIEGYVFYPLFDQIEEMEKSNNERFKVLGLKIIGDGSTQGYTAALREKYKDRDTYGELDFSQEALNDLVLKAHKKNMQIATHANGDKTVDYALTAYENAQKQFPRKDPRFRIEHATLTDQALLDRMAKIGATPSFTIEHVYLWGKVFKDQILGEPRADSIDRVNSAKKLGIKFTFNDDAPTTKPNPLLQMEVAVTREMVDGGQLNPSEGITIQDALKAFTIDAAWQVFRENELGSIEEGKLADFVVLDKNPLKVDSKKIHEIAVVQTWMDGKKVNEKTLK